MRALLTAAVAAAAIGLFIAPLSAAPVGTVPNTNATPLVQLAQYGGGGYSSEDGYHRYHRRRAHHYCKRYWHWACHYGHCRCYHD